MPIKNTHSRYGSMAILLHWLLAVIIIALFASGLWMLSLDYYDPWYTSVPLYHKAVGMLVVALTLWRLVWRLFNTNPGLDDIAGWEKRIALLVHWSFYLLVLLIGFSGYIISTADGQPIDIFGIVSVPAMTSLPISAQLSGDLHEYLAYVMMALVLLHTAAALKHHFVDKKSTLKRILPRFFNKS